MWMLSAKAAIGFCPAGLNHHWISTVSPPITAVSDDESAVADLFGPDDGSADDRPELLFQAGMWLMEENFV